MVNVNDEIKQAYDVSTTQIDKIVLDGQEYRISNVQLDDDCYDKGNIFGTAIAKNLEFEIQNSVNLEDKEFKYFTGIKTGEVINWINLGNFIVYYAEPNDTTNIAKISAMDYMLKSNIPYISSLDYESGTITLLNVLQEACTNANLELATTEFTNSDFIVDSNQFEEGTLIRQVFQAIAGVSGTVAKIKSDNKLYLINPHNITEVSKVFTLNNYEEAEIKRATHPINVVSLGMADIEGENITLRDEESIEKNGENVLAINDNPFAYTQAKREQLITALFDAIKGFEYKAYTFKCQGLPYIETLDKIQFIDREGNTYDSYIFRFNYKSPAGLESTIEAPSIINATVNYQNIPDALDIAKRTEYIVNKQEQYIEQLVKDVYEEDGVIHENFTNVYQNVTNIVNSVQNSGGSNLIKNSVMFAHDNNVPNDWEVDGEGTLTINSSSEALNSGGLSGHVFTLNNKIVRQKVLVKPSNEDASEKTYYTFSTKIKKDAVGSCYIKLYNSNEEHLIQLNEGESSFYGDYELKGLLPKDNYYIVEFYGSIDSNATFTDNMLAIGEYKTQWQQASGEIMNTQVNISINGVLVKSTIYQGDYTIMSPLEFAGYSNINGVITKVFSLNKDVTEVEKLRSKSEVTMPPIKIVPVTTGDLQGWAFVPST